MRAMACLLLLCSSVRAAEPRPAPVHLEAGDRAPFSGDLLHPLDLFEVTRAAECLPELGDLNACREARKAEQEIFDQQLTACEKARLAAENDRPKPIIIEKERPLTFFQEPVVLLTLGFLLGGGVAYLVAQ